VLAVVLSLIIQLVANPYHQALSSPAFASQGAAAISADLKAAFGEAAALCAHSDDHGAPGKHAPFGHCCDQCPLCRLAAHAVTFAPPAPPALPARLDADAHAIRAPPSRCVLPTYPAQPNPARAPPLAI
jgi:hypothetical protein